MAGTIEVVTLNFEPGYYERFSQMAKREDMSLAEFMLYAAEVYLDAFYPEEVQGEETTLHRGD